MCLPSLDWCPSPAELNVPGRWGLCLCHHHSPAPCLKALDKYLLSERALFTRSQVPAAPFLPCLPTRPRKRVKIQGIPLTPHCSGQRPPRGLSPGPCGGLPGARGREPSPFLRAGLNTSLQLPDHLCPSPSLIYKSGRFCHD